MLFLRDISSFMAANVGIFSELYKKFGKYCHYLYLCRLKMNKMDIANTHSGWCDGHEDSVAGTDAR